MRSSAQTAQRTVFPVGTLLSFRILVAAVAADTSLRCGVVRPTSVLSPDALARASACANIGVSAWVSDSCAVCVAVAGGVGGSVGVVASAGAQQGSSSGVFSYDGASVSGAHGSNVGGSGGSGVTVVGGSVGMAAYSASGRMGVSGCVVSEWMSDSSLRCVRATE